jgi:hypothetical protein
MRPCHYKWDSAYGDRFPILAGGLGVMILSTCVAKLCWVLLREGELWCGGMCLLCREGRQS